MTFECTLCGKNLPSRTGIWNHLKSKHKDQIQEQEVQEGKKKRSQLQQFIIWKDNVKPIKASSGRPQDDSVELNKRIKQKSEIQNEDISLRTLSNNHIIEILKEISFLPQEQLNKYLRNPQNEPYNGKISVEIFEEDNDKIKKFKKFVNRVLDFFTSEFNEKLIKFAENQSQIEQEQEQEQDGFLKFVLRNANEYSN